MGCRIHSWREVVWGFVDSNLEEEEIPRAVECRNCLTVWVEDGTSNWEAVYLLSLGP